MTENTKTAYEEKAKAQLDKIKAQMSLIQAEVSESKAEARIKLDRQMDDLNKQYDKAKEKLDQLSGATKDAWMDLREGVNAAISELKHSVDSTSKNKTPK